MARRLIVRPLAEADVDDAARWYEDERAGLAERFFSDVDRTFARIRERPFQFPVVTSGQSSLKRDQFAERGARMARREERAYWA
jgi:hypothetical protein